MNILILGINGDIGHAIFKKIYNQKDEYYLTYSKKKPNVNYKNVNFIKIDFLKLEALETSLKKLKNIFFDIIINNVGDSNPYKKFEKLNFLEIKKSLNINFLSPMKIIFELIKKAIIKKKSIYIINISSNTIKFIGSKNNLPYFLSKNSLDSFLIYISKHYSKNKIKVNIIRPGLIRTKKTTPLKNYSVSIFKKREKIVPIGKAGSADDIANLVNFLLQESSKYICGQIISVAGGE